MDKPPIPTQLEVSLNRWRRESAALQFCHVFLILTSIVCLMSVPALVGQVSDKSIQILSFIAAGAMALSNVFNLKDKANEMRQGYVALRGILVKYQATSKYSVDELVDDYIKISRNLGDIRTKDTII